MVSVVPVFLYFFIVILVIVVIRLITNLFSVLCRMNRRKADFKFVYKFLEDEL